MKTLIAVPAGDGWIHASTIQSLMGQMKGNRFLIVQGVSPVALARNKVVEAFLKSDCDKLWMIDSDTIPPADALEKLLEVDAAVVTGITPILKREGTHNNVYARNGTGELVPIEVPTGKTFKIDACGASCLLIDRSVLKKMDAPWFAEMWSQDNTHVSEDIFFCNSMKEQGIEIVAHSQVVCQHVKEVLL